jgi:hypothetical protein
VRSWTVGACSQAVKAASCFAAFDRETPIATPAGERIVDDYWRDPTPAAAPAGSIGRTGGFDWGDAGIGAGAALGIALLVGGTAAGLLLARQNRRRVASA